MGARMIELRRDQRGITGLETAINMAFAVGAPLLVTGGPGTGKTQLAYFLGNYFGIEIRAYLVKSISTARDLQYEPMRANYRLELAPDVPAPAPK